MFVSLVFQLSNLGIMTARLLPALQECFKSEYVSVRIEAAMVSTGSSRMIEHRLQSLFSDDIRDSSGNASVSRTPRLHVDFPNPSGNFHVCLKSLSRRFGFFSMQFLP